MIKYLKSLFMSVSACLLFGSCGDQIAEDAFFIDIDQLESNCTLEANQLDKILDKEIQEEISCVEDSINQFVKFVQREDEAYIQRLELEKFINKFFENDAAHINGTLIPIFKVSSLILKDPIDKMSVDKLGVFFNVIRLLNREGVRLKKLITKIDNGENYWQLRPEILEVIHRFTAGFYSQVGDLSGTDVEVDLVQLLEEVRDNFELKEENFDIELIKDYLIAKPIFLGGEKESLSSFETHDLISRLNNLAEMGLDMVYIEDLDFSKGAEETLFYLNFVKNIQEELYPWEDTKLMFTLTELNNVLKRYIDTVDWDAVYDSVAKFKSRVIGGAFESFNFFDIKNVIQIFKVGIEKMYFHSVTYDHFSDQLDHEEEVELEFVDLPEYGHLGEIYLRNEWEVFKNIAYNYKLYQNQDGYLLTPKYLQRTYSGHVILSVIRHSLGIFLDVYGVEREDQRAFEKNSLRYFVMEYKSLLSDMGLFPSDVERFLSEILLGADLFRFASDNDEYLELDELTQYVNIVLNGVKMSEEIHEMLGEYCEPVGLEDLVYEPQCFRDNFFTIFFDELNYGEYYPVLKEYLDYSGPKTAADLILDVEKGSRIDPDESTPVTEEDITRCLVNLTHIETTMKKYDKNYDDILSSEEILGLYELAKSVIAKLTPFGPESKLNRIIFLWIVKERRIPEISNIGDIWSLVKFGFDKKAQAGVTGDRQTMSAIIRVIGEKTRVKSSTPNRLQKAGWKFLERQLSDI